MKYEVEAMGVWEEVNEDTFRCWQGPRRLDGQPYHGPVYYLYTDIQVAHIPPHQCPN